MRKFHICFWMLKHFSCFLQAWIGEWLRFLFILFPFLAIHLSVNRLDRFLFVCSFVCCWKPVIYRTNFSFSNLIRRGLFGCLFQQTHTHAQPIWNGDEENNEKIHIAHTHTHKFASIIRIILILIGRNYLYILLCICIVMKHIWFNMNCDFVVFFFCTCGQMIPTWYNTHFWKLDLIWDI